MSLQKVALVLSYKYQSSHKLCSVVISTIKKAVLLAAIAWSVYNYEYELESIQMFVV